jgi:hypothetical protein
MAAAPEARSPQSNRAVRYNDLQESLPTEESVTIA